MQEKDLSDKFKKECYHIGEYVNLFGYHSKTFDRMVKEHNIKAYYFGDVWANGKAMARYHIDDIRPFAINRHVVALSKVCYNTKSLRYRIMCDFKKYNSVAYNQLKEIIQEIEEDDRAKMRDA